VSILIGFNLHYPLNDRVKLSQKSLLKLKNQFDIELINLQFENYTCDKSDGILNLHVLKESSKQFTKGSNRDLPMIKNMFDSLCEYADKNKMETFIFVN
jgi:hypothetical protein